MGALASYNRDIMAIQCPDCGASPLRRCQLRKTNGPTHAHRGRLAAAGWKWDHKNKKLEKL